MDLIQQNMVSGLFWAAIGAGILLILAFFAIRGIVGVVGEEWRDSFDYHYHVWRHRMGEKRRARAANKRHGKMLGDWARLQSSNDSPTRNRLWQFGETKDGCFMAQCVATCGDMVMMISVDTLVTRMGGKIMKITGDLQCGDLKIAEIIAEKYDEESRLSVINLVTNNLLYVAEQFINAREFNKEFTHEGFVQHDAMLKGQGTMSMTIFADDKSKRTISLPEYSAVKPDNGKGTIPVAFNGQSQSSAEAHLLALAKEGGTFRDNTPVKQRHAVPKEDGWKTVKNDDDVIIKKLVVAGLTYTISTTFIMKTEHKPYLIQCFLDVINVAGDSLHAHGFNVVFDRPYQAKKESMLSLISDLQEKVAGRIAGGTDMSAKNHPAYIKGAEDYERMKQNNDTAPDFDDGWVDERSNDSNLVKTLAYGELSYYTRVVFVDTPKRKHSYFQCTLCVYDVPLDKLLYDNVYNSPFGADFCHKTTMKVLSDGLMTECRLRILQNLDMPDTETVQHIKPVGGNYESRSVKKPGKIQPSVLDEQADAELAKYTDDWKQGENANGQETFTRAFENCHHQITIYDNVVKDDGTRAWTGRLDIVRPSENFDPLNDMLFVKECWQDFDVDDDDDHIQSQKDRVVFELQVIATRMAKRPAIVAFMNGTDTDIAPAILERGESVLANPTPRKSAIDDAVTEPDGWKHNKSNTKDSFTARKPLGMGFGKISIKVATHPKTEEQSVTGSLVYIEHGVGAQDPTEHSIEELAAEPVTGDLGVHIDDMALFLKTSFENYVARMPVAENDEKPPRTIYFSHEGLNCRNVMGGWADGKGMVAVTQDHPAFGLEAPDDVLTHKIGGGMPDGVIFSPQGWGIVESVLEKPRLVNSKHPIQWWFVFKGQRNPDGTTNSQDITDKCKKLASHLAQIPSKMDGA